MGMAASQVRFLQLTNRKHDIGRELQHLSLQKTSLTRDMQAITKEYQTALCSKSMKWSNNSGISYTDLSYSTLMHPNEYNSKSPIMISDSTGKIVLNKKYQKYAEMLDQAGGKWEGDIKNQILSELTGIPVDVIENADLTNDAAYTAADNYSKSRNEFDEWKSKAKEQKKGGTEYLTLDKLAKNLGIVNGYDLSKLYTKGEKSDYVIRSASDIKSLAEGIKKNMSKYFVDDETYLGVTDKTAFEEGCKAFVDYYSALINDTSENADDLRKADGLIGSVGDWTIDISAAFAHIMGGYLINGSYSYTNSTNEKTYPLRDTTSTAWKNWYEELKSKQDAMDAAKTTYNSAIDTANQVMTADQESALEYYNLLFQSIADNGWTYDSQVEESEYLTQMFQNNTYYLTTISVNSCYNPDEEESLRNRKYDYDTSLASNYDKIFTVNDSDAREQALVDYEFKKGQINIKETRIDTRMKNLETEQSAITKMLESINQVKSDNIERTFGIWG